MLITPITTDENSAEISYAKLFAITMFIAFVVIVVGIVAAIPQLAISGMVVATALLVGFLSYQTRAVLGVR